MVWFFGYRGVVGKGGNNLKKWHLNVMGFYFNLGFPG